MTTGPNKDFPVKINRQGIANIVQRAFVHARSLEPVRLMMEAGAPHEDIKAALLLTALSEYLQEQRCQPDFELVLGE